MVTLDGLVPKDHLLRKIDAVIDFSFIHDRVEGLYCADNGRPALDPTLMFKALFIGYLLGIRSERQLMREIEVNVAYRWFLRMKLTDRVFDASTLSQVREGKPKGFFYLDHRTVDGRHAQGNGRALLCRCQTVSRTPPCPVPKSDPRRMPVPAGSRRPKHQKDRPGAHQSTKTRPRLRPNPSADQK